MFGRRVAVLLRSPPPARLPAATPFQCQHDLPARTLLCQSRRTYATPGRPRKAVGEPSRPVKRAVKKSTATATDPDAPAKKKNEAQKEKAAKKPAVKKAAPKKVLTEEQKAAQKAAKTAKLDKSKTLDLKKAALEPPKKGNQMSAYTIFVMEKGKELKGGSGGGLGGQHQRLAEHSRVLSARWKEMSAADIEHYNHLAHTDKEAAQAEYKRWVQSHTPEQIQIANRARKALRRKAKPVEAGKRKGSQWPAIDDERAVKRPITAFAQFCINRHASGDLNNITLPERAKLIAKEWKALSESEKSKYKALQTEDAKRYADEYSNAYGHTPPTYIGGQPPQLEAAAAA